MKNFFFALLIFCFAASTSLAADVYLVFEKELGNNATLGRAMGKVHRAVSAQLKKNGHRVVESSTGVTSLAILITGNTGGEEHLCIYSSSRPQGGITYLGLIPKTDYESDYDWLASSILKDTELD